MDIAEELLKGNRLALSRAITAIENEYDEATEIMKKLYPRTGHAFVLGVTGPPGAGKSTLTDKLAREYRNQGKTVGIIAVDPTSPFTGGAILGDRIRMNGLTLDEGVFIRSEPSSNRPSSKLPALHFSTKLITIPVLRWMSPTTSEP